MDILRILEKLGLKDKEPDVYLTLLKLSGFFPASIISQKSGLNRTTTYKVLTKLTKMGLVTKSMRHGITSFSAEDANERLEKLVTKKKRNLESVSKDLHDILPGLLGSDQMNTNAPTMRYYEGMDGIKKVYEDTLKEAKTIYAFDDFQDFPLEFREWIMNNYIPRRIKKNIFAYVLTPKNRINTKYRKGDSTGCRETRFLPKSAFQMKTEINIYGNKVAFFSYCENDPFAVILESAAIVSSLLAIFHTCWAIAK